LTSTTELATASGKRSASGQRQGRRQAGHPPLGRRPLCLAVLPPALPPSACCPLAACRCQCFAKMADFCQIGKNAIFWVNAFTLYFANSPILAKSPYFG